MRGSERPQIEIRDTSNELFTSVPILFVIFLIINYKFLYSYKVLYLYMISNYSAERLRKRECSSRRGPSLEGMSRSKCVFS